MFARYGVKTHRPGQYEVDHLLIALELGGSNAISNLFPEAGTPRPGFREKDKLENQLSALVCKRLVPLAVAQTMIAKDWIATARWVNEHFPGSRRSVGRSFADASANGGRI